MVYLPVLGCIPKVGESYYFLQSVPTILNHWYCRLQNRNYNYKNKNRCLKLALIYNYFKIIVIGPRRLAGDVRLSQLRGFRGAHRRRVQANPHLRIGSPGARVPPKPQRGAGQSFRSIPGGGGHPLSQLRALKSGNPFKNKQRGLQRSF